MTPSVAIVRGRELLRTVLVRPATRVHGGLLASIALAYAWVERAQPPADIRTQIESLTGIDRLLVLTIGWAVWLLLCTPATVRLLCSAPARALRSIPLGSRDWARALTPVLVVFQLPAALVIAYGCWPGGPGAAVLRGGGLALTAALAQPHLVAPRRLVRASTWAALISLPALAVPLGAELVVVIAAFVCSLAHTAGYRRPPPESPTRRYRVGWSKCRTWALARPVVVTTISQLPRWCSALLIAQVVLAGHLYFALSNGAAVPGDALTAGVLWLGTLGGVALATVGRRRAAQSGWYLEALPVTRVLAVGALALPALLFASPALAATGLASVGAVGARSWPMAVAGLGVVAWAASFAAWLALEDDRGRRTARPIRWAAVALLPLIAMLVTGRLLAALPLAVIQALVAWRIEPAARATRRRFEVYDTR